jgi:putative hydrolase of the HAD superfamily
VLHVGDHPVDDVLGALDAGFQAAWINRHDDVWNHEHEPHAEVKNLIELVDLLDAEN